MVFELRSLSEQCDRLGEMVRRERMHPTRPFLQEADDDTYHWLYQPHTITAGILILAATIFTAFVYAPQYAESYDDRLRLGIRMMVVVFLVYCVVQLRDGLLLRPHPAVWRAVHGLGIMYLMFLVMLLMQDADGARATLRFMMPELPTSKPASNDRVYASDCRVPSPGHADGTWGALGAVVWDAFIIAHFLGWVGKALMLRDWKLGMALSILWELAEYSMQHSLPNFAECWWDHWIVDVALCNTGGLALGMALCHRLEMGQYNWTGSTKRLTVGGKVRRAVQQFTPYSFTKYSWDVFSNWKRLAGVGFAIVVMLTVELNAFTLKHVMWIEPEHVFNTYRLMLWFLLSVPALREYYQYATDPTCKRMGQGVWLGLGLMLAELAISIKFEPELYASLPEVVVWAWSWCIGLVLLWAAFKFDLIPCWPDDVRGRGHRVRHLVTNGLIMAAALPPLWMAAQLDVGWGQGIPDGGSGGGDAGAVQG